MEPCHVKLLNNVLRLLQFTAINYFSFVIFENKQPIVTYCNNQGWLNYCKLHYGTLIPEPILKYIFASKLNIINWNLLTFEKEAKKYMQTKNRIVRIKASVSISYYINTRLIILTFGSNLNSECIIDFFQHKLIYLYFLAKKIVISQAA